MGAVGGLDEVLKYNAETGDLIWLIRPRHDIPVGSVAGTLDSRGYIQICYKGRFYRAHRIAWYLQTGLWPEQEIDHKNGVRNDNRWCNLRLCTSSENKHNIGGARINSSSGVLGAAWDKQTGKYLSSIQINGKRVHLGRFNTAEEAGRAYLEAKNKFHPSHLRLI